MKKALITLVIVLVIATCTQAATGDMSFVDTIIAMAGSCTVGFMTLLGLTS